jgi:hypothetical protein
VRIAQAAEPALLPSGVPVARNPHTAGVVENPVDLRLRAVVDAARELLEDEEPRPGAQAARAAELLLVACCRTLGA